MTPEQKVKLDELMAELDGLPTPELIAEAGRLRCSLPLNAEGKKRMHLAIGGAIAAEKLLVYIEELRDVDARRGAIGRRIYELQQEETYFRVQESLEAAKPAVLAAHLSGRQEVTFHFFAVCVGWIERLLPIAARAAGFKVSKPDRDLLATFRPLRDYYEHLEERLPGGKYQNEVVTEKENAGEWRVCMELPMDHHERVVFNDMVVDVTPRGVAAVEEVLQRNWAQLKASTRNAVRKHFEASPAHIPRREEVQHELLASLGKGIDQWIG